MEFVVYPACFLILRKNENYFCHNHYRVKKSLKIENTFSGSLVKLKLLENCEYIKTEVKEINKRSIKGIFVHTYFKVFANSVSVHS